LADDQIVERGRAAWERLKKGGRDWEDWKEVGAALLDGRREAMRKAQTNEPAGKAYSKAFSDWLKANHFDDIDKSDRAKLLQIMEQLEEVEAMRATLSTARRTALNHPNSVWRAWNKTPAFWRDYEEDAEEDDGDEESGGEAAKTAAGQEADASEIEQQRHLDRWAQENGWTVEGSWWTKVVDGEPYAINAVMLDAASIPEVLAEAERRERIRRKAAATRARNQAEGEQEPQQPGGRNGIERNIESGKNNLLELINEIESETALVDEPPVEDAEHLAALQKYYDEPTLAIIEGGAHRLLKFVALLREQPKPKEQSTQADAT
jgi:hypothetical protein